MTEDRFRRLAISPVPVLTVEGIRVPDRCQCGNPIALSGPAASHSLCVFCWEREKELTNEAIERAGQRLKEFGA